MVTPRMKNSALSRPGSPESCWVIIPAILPPRAVVRLLEGTLSSAGRIVEMELTTLSFFCLENATTMASSRAVASSSIIMRYSRLSATRTRLSTYPIRLTTMYWPSAAEMVKLPLSSTRRPLFVPSTMTAAPRTGSPLESTTRPLTVRWGPTWETAAKDAP